MPGPACHQVKDFHSKYFLHKTELESATAAKYLGITISDDFSWGTHIN